MPVPHGVWIALGCLLISACGATSDLRSATSPLARPSPTSSLFQAPVVGSSARAGSPIPLPAGINCRVPYADISEASGGFIFYPGGKQQSDPNSAVALPGNTPGQLGLNPGLTYDYATGTWFPVPPNWVAPNGSFYVYNTDAKIRAVNTADGSDGDVTIEGGWYLIGVDNNGVYLGKMGGPGAPVPGVWFVAFGYAPYQLIDHASWQRYYKGGLWTVDRDGNLIRYDVTTASETVWAKGLQNVASVVGFDFSDEPVVNTGGALAMYRADGSRIAIWPGTNGLSAAFLVGADPMGLWFSVGGGLVGAPGHGVYMWTPGVGAKLISAPEVNVFQGCGP